MSENGEVKSRVTTQERKDVTKEEKRAEKNDDRWEQEVKETAEMRGNDGWSS